MARRFCFVLLGLVLTSVSLTALPGESVGTSLQHAPATPNYTFTEFPLPTSNSQPASITDGPDGNLWFTEAYAPGGGVGKVTPAGNVTEFPAGLAGGITTGSDGNLWFTGSGHIGRITTGGQIAQFEGGGLGYITAGPDGNLWFTEYREGKIGRITPMGTITLFTVNLLPLGITSGPDGSLWVASGSAGAVEPPNEIARITTTGEVTHFPVPSNPSLPREITSGPDGNLWFTEYNVNNGSGAIGRITISGTITEFPIPTHWAEPYGIASGLDNDLWFTEAGAGKIGRITTTGEVTEFQVPAPGDPTDITVGPDGNVWFTEQYSNNIVRLSLGPDLTPTATVVPTPPPGSLTIDNVDLSRMIYPSGVWTTINTDSSTTEGNVARIEPRVTNHGATDQFVDIYFYDDETGLALPDPQGQHFGLLVSVPAGQSVTADYYWDTTGFTWDAPSTPHPNRRIRVDINVGVTLYDSKTASVTITPRPVVLVHGWWDNGFTWNYYRGSAGFLAMARQPYYDWTGYAADLDLSNGNTWGVLEEGHGLDDHIPTNTIGQNSQVLKGYIDHVRYSTQAWHVDLVAHSMGGLISRAYIQNHMDDASQGDLDSRPLVSHLVMLGTPNEGSVCANLLIAATWPSVPMAPATWELTTGYIQDWFNPRVHLDRGVPFSVAAGDVASWTCSDHSEGDDWVRIDSAIAPFITDSQVFQGTHHSPMPNYDYLFNDFVRPRLITTPPTHPVKSQTGSTRGAAVASATAKTNSVSVVTPTVEPQIFFTSANTVAVGGSVDVPIQVASSSAFGVVLPGASPITATLRDPNGTIIDSIGPSSPRATNRIWSFNVDNPPVGNWDLNLQNGGAVSQTVSSSAWVSGTSLLLSLSVGSPSDTGQIPLTATLTNNGSPLSGAPVTATLSLAGGLYTQIDLSDAGHPGSYQGIANVTDPGTYAVLSRAVVNGTARMAVEVIPYVCPLQFTDMPSDNPFYSYVRCLACQNVLGGYGDGTFRPGNNITRGQLSKIVSNAAIFSDPVGSQIFEDVPPGSPFYDFVQRLASRGYIGGYPCGGEGEPCVPPDNRPYFRPNANATRGQISKVVSNTAEYNDPPGVQIFEDVPPGSTFYDCVQRLASRSSMGGYPCGAAGEPCIAPDNRPYFRPGNNATRGQTSKIVSNTFLPNCQIP
jgi:streptogramin lyase/pimeloyl-ACP methyl ester carboxylesterase